MRCKKHYIDRSSFTGVCATCLRERLFALIAAQAQAEAQSQAQAQAQTLDESNRESETNPVIPRSVSPYISRRKTGISDSLINNQHDSDRDRNRNRNRNRNRSHNLPDRRFFSTPEVASNAGGYDSCRKKQHRFIRFSVLLNLFRSKKRDEDLNPRSTVSASNHRGSCGIGDNRHNSMTSVTSSPFWFSNATSAGGRRKKQTCCSSASSTVSGTGVMRKQYCVDRGMSPVRYSDCDGGDEELYDGSSGYETCESRKQTPSHPAVRRRGGGGGGGHRKNVSGMSFCLSPLVRASPCRNWHHKGVAPVDGGDIGAPVTVRPQLYDTKVFCANRSRKLADFGRIDKNR